MSARQDLKSLIQDYRTTFSTAPGKRVLEDMQRAYSKRTSFTKGAPDVMAFKEGQRAVLIAIDRMLEEPLETLLQPQQGEADL